MQHYLSWALSDVTAGVGNEGFVVIVVVRRNAPARLAVQNVLDTVVGNALLQAPRKSVTTPRYFKSGVILQSTTRVVVLMNLSNVNQYTWSAGVFEQHRACR